jgi:hypothetical protein
VRIETHDPLRAAVSVVAPCESDVAVVEGDEATVRHGDALGVARQIGEHLLGPCERAFGVDDPFRPPHRRSGAICASKAVVSPPPGTHSPFFSDPSMSATRGTSTPWAPGREDHNWVMA